MTKTGRFELPAIGLELHVRLSRESCGGAITVIESHSAPGYGPPLHRRAEAQICYVLSGRYLYEVEGRRFYADCGDVIEVPGGSRHAFVNVADRPASQLVLTLPGFDALGCFSELAALLAPEPTDPQELWHFERQWGVEFLGPPLQASPSPGRAPYRRHTAQFKQQLCRDIRSGAVGRREAQKKYSLSDNLIHLWLARYDRDQSAGPGSS